MNCVYSDIEFFGVCIIDEEFSSFIIDFVNCYIFFIVFGYIIGKYGKEVGI